ncbi:YhdH/YhfP family quinone oxidoreductase [Rhodohalobacter mucosus]|uniref:Oxidoreductase n=1 Tax=Rhodohalobacter mucosus TaxID=2079485 RepID=A0A316TPQ4_9BACT|nr:YhdH/YhfP family quinone oxidoreductase [Rhodohalobacter mucosus]PWN05798.1 oxidoreductase [Rhodohalobacter mucosus]
MISKTYKALVAEEKSDGEFTQSVKELKTENLPDHDVLIEVHYSSLNYKDALSASGNRSVSKSYPFTPGIDAAGIVRKSRDSRYQPGDQVIVTSYDLGMNTPGGFGQYIRVPASWVLHLPDCLRLNESMMIGTSGITAAFGVEKIDRLMPATEGDVLVTGATGGVGSFSVGLLNLLGYRVIAATGKPEQARFLKNIGASDVIERDAVSDVPDKPMLSSRWRAAFDTVGGSMLDSVLRQMEHNGVVACCGNVLGGELKTSIYPFILRGISLMGVDSGIAHMQDRVRIWDKLATEWKIPHLEQLCKTRTLSDLPDEIEKILKGGQTGKVLISLRD